MLNRLRKKGISLFLAVVVLLSFTQAAWGLTVGEERELGKRFMAQVMQHMPLVEDPVINAYVSGLGHKIMEAVGPQPFDYKFYVANESVFNAFAGPGGNIVIYRGLITTLDSEEELAGVMAHEIAHGTCRHVADNISRGKKIQLASLAGAVASLLLGAGAPGVVGSLAAGTSASLAYTREDERQADELGTGYMVDSGYGVSGFLSAMKKMREASLYGPNEVPSYLMTHPATEERMATMDLWVSAHPENAKAAKPIDPYPFNKVRARAIGLYENPDTALPRLKAMVDKDPRDAAAHYGLGSLMGRTNNRKKAVEEMTTAVNLRPFDPDLLTGLGKAYYEEGRMGEAEKTLDAALRADPRLPEAHLWLGRTYMAQDKLEQAEIHLSKAVDLFPGDTNALYSLGQTLGRMGKMARAHYYLGLYNLRTRDPKNALYHLNKALDLAKDDPELLKKIQAALPGGDRPEPPKEEEPGEGEEGGNAKSLNGYGNVNPYLQPGGPALSWDDSVNHPDLQAPSTRVYRIWE